MWNQFAFSISAKVCPSETYKHTICFRWPYTCCNYFKQTIYLLFLCNRLTFIQRRLLDLSRGDKRLTVSNTWVYKTSAGYPRSTDLSIRIRRHKRSMMSQLTDLIKWPIFYAKLRVAHAPGMPGTGLSWCMSGSLTAIAEETFRLARRMHNQQFCVSGKRPMGKCQWITP